MKWTILETLEHAEIARRIHNAGREWMGDPSYVEPEQQVKWFERVKSLPRRDFAGYLVGDPPCAYARLERREGRMWITLAVDPKERGRGIGTQIYDALAVQAGEPVFAGIRTDNLPSIYAAQRAGYRITPGICPPGIGNPDGWLVLSRSR